MNLLRWFQRICFDGHGRCYRCRRPWCRVNGHNTWYTADRGMFPLCEDCWRDLTPETRLPYYEALFNRWPRAKDEHWKDVYQAVMEGK